ncbi:hypothetical protein [Nonomuraea cavernae]|uniref:hypothetical protein n=1 Tax=Nonomuraea cavernae TaxID=2045107 RepID=UPI0033CC5744
MPFGVPQEMPGISSRSTGRWRGSLGPDRSPDLQIRLQARLDSVGDRAMTPNAGKILLAATLLAAALLVLTGCGQDGSGVPPQSLSSSDDQSVAGQDPCGGSVEKVKKKVRQAQIRSVTVEGQCTSLSIETSLGDEESGAAKKICDSAAEVAYSGDTSAIRVLGASGKELSVGIVDAPCLAQP